MDSSTANASTNRHNYERRTIITMELMSSYFVNIFYNELYIAAKQRRDARESPTITDGYKHALQAWINSLNKPHLYKRMIKGLHDYYAVHMGYNRTLDDCIDNIVHEFVPDGYINSLTKTQKMCVLSTVIKDSNMEFIKCIVQKHFPIIIDSHTADNAQVIKDEMVGILLLERERMYQRFIEQMTAEHGKKTSDTDVIDKLKKKLRMVLHEKYELNKRLIQMRQIILKYNKTTNAPSAAAAATTMTPASQTNLSIGRGNDAEAADGKSIDDLMKNFTSLFPDTATPRTVEKSYDVSPEPESDTTAKDSCDAHSWRRPQNIDIPDETGAVDIVDIHDKHDKHDKHDEHGAEMASSQGIEQELQDIEKLADDGAKVTTESDDHESKVDHENGNHESDDESDNASDNASENGSEDMTMESADAYELINAIDDY